MCPLMPGRYSLEAEIRVSGGDDVAEITALFDWLRHERALAGTIRAVRRQPGETELGGVYDLLAVALGSGGTVAVLARSLATWLRTRRPDITVTVTSPSGTVTIDAHRVKDDDVIPLLRGALAARDEA